MTSPQGLFSLKNVHAQPGGLQRTIILRFNERVTELHQRQLMEAIQAWMIGQQMIAKNGGMPPSREQITQFFEENRKGVAEAQQAIKDFHPDDPLPKEAR